MQNDIKYLVHIDGDDAFMRVVGKAGYLNCRSAGEFFNIVAEKNCKRLLIDLAECSGMDSTFLGMIAGAALRLSKNGAQVVVENPNERNRQLIDNLGIYRLVKIAQAKAVQAEVGTQLAVENVPQASILAAHENLVEADAENLKKFEDVISFLKKEIK